MLTTGLPISRYVSVTVSLTTPGISADAINTMLLIGSSDVIDVGERMRQYTDISDVAQDFLTSSPEFQGAQSYFAQNPRPRRMMIGRWVQTPTAAHLLCAVLPPIEQSIMNWRAITDGSFIINVNNNPGAITGLDFSMQTNLNGVAQVIQDALDAGSANASVQWTGWTGQRFVFSSNTTGSTQTIDYLMPAGMGTDISAMLRGDPQTADRVVWGADPETALAALAEIDMLFSSQFYAIVCPEGTDDDQEQLAAYVEASDPVHYLGVNSADTNVLDPMHTTDIGSVMAGFGYNKTAVCYSTSNPHFAESYIGRIVTTIWTGVNTAITLMYKRSPGTMVEQLSTNMANSIKDKHVNVYAGVSNGAQIIQDGTSASGEFTDTIWGADALALDVQRGLFNTLYTTATKIPQTDAGMSVLINAAKTVLSRYVNNGYLAPGTWNATGFGEINQGDVLPMGYYVYAPSMGDQDPGDRAARISPLMQIAAKCAGAIHYVDVLIYINQ